MEHLQHDRLEPAEAGLLSVLELAPGHPDALHFLGVLRHAQGDDTQAVELIRSALASAPSNGSAWNNLGNILLLSGAAEEAAAAYTRATEQPGSPAEAARALNNLGVLHRKLDHLAQSEAVLRRALELDGRLADAWYNLSATLLKQGRITEGLHAHSMAVTASPERSQSRQEVIRALLFLRETTQAAALLREWLDSDPGNPVAQHMLAACESDPAAAPERASDGYVQQVFDGFAASFDSKLESLDYRAPELVACELQGRNAVRGGSLDIVDAGCGTGLCGPLLRPLARTLAGCDLSVGMLRRAKARNVYDVLHQAELTHYLATQPGAFDAVVSADTLCYFGPLERVLSAAHHSLRDRGWLAFTVEALPESGTEALPHRLQPNGRYAHAGRYLSAAVAQAGFELSSLRQEALRQEAGAPVPGFVVTAQRRPGLRGEGATP